MLNLKLILPVWGDKYISYLEEFALSWLLNEGNILEYSENTNNVVELIIVTIYLDYKNIDKLEIIQKLIRASVKIKYILMDGTVIIDKYKRLSHYYMEGMKYINNNSSLPDFVAFLTADIFYSNNSIKFAIEKMINDNYKVILATGIQVNREDLLNEIKNSKFINNRELAKITLNNLHLNSKDVIIYSNKFRNNWPSHVYWYNYTNIMYCKCFHLHPFIVKFPSKKIRKMSGSVDVDFVLQMGYKITDCYIIKDSDELILLGLNNIEEHFNTEEGTSSYEKIINWSIIHTSKFERELFKNIYTLHTTENIYDEILFNDYIHFQKIFDDSISFVKIFSLKVSLIINYIIYLFIKLLKIVLK